MRDMEIDLPPGASCDEIARTIDEAVDRANLRVTLRDTLKKFPACIHWHAKNGRESGTQEVTLWPRARRAWFTIQSGRSASWIEARIESMTEFIIHRLRDA